MYVSFEHIVTVLFFCANHQYIVYVYFFMHVFFYYVFMQYRIVQAWATYGPRAGSGPRDDFMRPAGTCRNINSFREPSRGPSIFFYRTSEDE